MEEIVLRNGILKSTKDVEVFKKYVLIHDTVEGWTTYKVPIKLYNKFKENTISYWDMMKDKKTKEV